MVQCGPLEDVVLRSRRPGFQLLELRFLNQELVELNQTKNNLLIQISQGTQYAFLFDLQRRGVQHTILFISKFCLIFGHTILLPDFLFTVHIIHNFLWLVNNQLRALLEVYQAKYSFTLLIFYIVFLTSATILRSPSVINTAISIK
jgi:hypothetical protein